MDSDKSDSDRSHVAKRWIITVIAIVCIAGVGWWLVRPKASAIAEGNTTILAKAPPAAQQRPLNADGAPRSD